MLPLLPTTPFLLVALWALSRSHPALAARLYRHPRFGPPLRNWREQRAIGRRAKITALTVLVASAALTAATAPATVAALSVAMLSLVGSFIVTRPAPRETGPRDDPESRTKDPVRRVSSSASFEERPMTTTSPLADRSGVSRVTAAALFARGFRPFYLLAGIMAAFWIPAWVGLYLGPLPLAPALPAGIWHAHEMLFGVTAAVLVGFLYTAIPNWTGQPTPAGGVLAALAGLWLLGRVLLLAGDTVPPALTAAVDVAFLPLAALGALRPLAAKRNWRNIAFPFVLAGLGVANLFVHLEAMGVGNLGRTGIEATLAVMAMILVVMTGRVVPFFTANRLPETQARRHATLDWMARVAVLLAIIGSLARPASPETAIVAVAAGVLLLVRAVPWKPLATRRVPMLWILHLGNFWLAAAFLLDGLVRLGLPLPPSAAIHALTIGAIGSLTLGMMARSALGHTGRSIEGGLRLTAAFHAITASAALRVLGPVLPPDLWEAALVGSALAWSLAFGLFTLQFLPILLRPRTDGRPG